MKPVFAEIDNWANGINTAASADALPPGFSPRGRNTMLVNIGAETAQMGSRTGMSLVNATPISGSPTLLGQYQLKRIDGTKFHLLVSSGGRLDKKNDDNTTSVVNAAAFTSGTTKFPAFATANNCAIIANGTDLKKTDGATVWGVGMTRPAAPTAVAAAGGAMAVASWDVALTYYNSNTNEESSLSDFTTVSLSGGNLQINVSWSVPSDAQVTHVRVYVRNQSVGANAYLAIAGSGLTPNADATYNGFAPATTATVVNVTATTYGALKLIAPTTTQNNPPTVTWKYPVWHNGRLFLFDAGNAYYSNITDLVSHPESFDPNNIQPVNPTADGDTITGAISAWGNLYIFKKYSMWVLNGYDPSSWTLTQVSDRYGCGSHRSIKFVNGSLFWWSNTALGPLMLSTPAFSGAATAPLEIGKELLATTVSDSQLNTLGLNTVVAEVDEPNGLVLFAVPGLSQSRNTLVIPFNYRVKRFVSDSWTPMDIASMCVAEDLVGTRGLYVGGYAGQLFKWDNSTNDGVPSATTASGSISAATSTTLTDAAAAFATTGGGLIERYVYHIPAMGSVQRRRITGNTGTQLTVTPAWDQTPLVNDTYVVGAVDWQLDTPWQKFEAPFIKKRLEALYLDAFGLQNGATIYADIFTKDDAGVAKKTLTFSVPASGSVYDTAVYDNATYDASPSLNKRKKVGLTGKSIRVRFRQLQSNIQVQCNKVGFQASMLSART